MDMQGPQSSLSGRVRIGNRQSVPAPNTSVPDMAATATAHRKHPSGVPEAFTGKHQDSAESWGAECRLPGCTMGPVQVMAGTFHIMQGRAT